METSTLWIRVELIDARDNKQVWGAEFDRGPADPLLAQREIARIASNKMRPHLAGAPQHVIEQQSADPQAYESLLRGDFYLNRFGVENRKKAVAAYQEAIAIDQNSAEIYDAGVVRRAEGLRTGSRPGGGPTRTGQSRPRCLELGGSRRAIPARY